MQELELQEARLLEKLAKQGLILSDKRKSAATSMGSGIEIELDDLRMAEARFNVDFQTKPDLNGAPVENGTRLAFDQSGWLYVKDASHASVTMIPAPRLREDLAAVRVRRPQNKVT